MSKNAPHSLLRSATSMGAATLISRVMGLVREQVFAYLFGAGNFTDAFNVAFRIPNLLRNLFAEGAMSASLVPTFTEVKEKEGDERAWQVAGIVFRVLFVAVGIFSIAGIVFAPAIVSLYASAFKIVPGKFELTVLMTRIMFPFFPLVALAAAFMAVLNSCGVFFLPALASALFNITSVAVGVFFAVVLWGKGGGVKPIEGMAIGVVAGGFVQALVQVPSLYRVGYRNQPKLREIHFYRDPALRKMLTLMAPGVVGLGATQVNILINTWLATSQGPGAVSWLSYAFRLMQFPIGIFGVSLASAALPSLSRSWVRKEVSVMRETLLTTLNHVWRMNLPASVGLGVLGVPIIALLFQYGRFSSEDTRATALALAMYAIGLGAYSAVKVLVPAFYAMGNTRIPVISSAASIVLGIALNLVLIRPFGFWGLALGTSLSSIANMLFLLFAMGAVFRARGVETGQVSWLRSWATPLVQQLSISVVMGAVCWASFHFMDAIESEADWIRMLASSSDLPSGISHSSIAVAVLRGFKVGLVLAEGVGLVFFLDIFTKKLKKKLSPEQT